MNQSFAWALFAGGLPTFLSSVAEFALRHHGSIGAMTTPDAVGHLVIMTAAFCLTVFGALCVQLPREGRHADRVTDRTLDVLQKEERS